MVRADAISPVVTGIGHKETRPVGPIEQARRARGLRQADLARLAGVSRSYICFIEQGWRPPTRRQGSIAAVLGVRADELWPRERDE